MDRRYKRARWCHWWRGGHQWSKWKSTNYFRYMSSGRKYEVTMDRRECEKCDETETRNQI